MKATVIVDNKKSENLNGEWGLSVYIEYRDQKILLDVGASNLFAENAEKLGLSIADIDAAVLSHAHFDHANGMEKFFEMNEKAKFFVQKDCCENCYSKYWIFSKYIGIPKGISEKYSDRFVYAEDDYKVSDGVWLIPHRTEGLEKIGKREHMYQRRNNTWYPDDFSHEQSLVFETEKGLVIFNSCSHGGAANIIREVSEAAGHLNNLPVYAIIGGFHLYNKSEAEVREFAKRVKDTGIKYVCTGHCTGEKSYAVLAEELGDMLHQLECGLVMEF